MSFETYHNLGYGFFKLTDLLSASDIDKIHTLGDMAMSVPMNNKNYTYTLSVLGFHNDPKWPFQISYDEVEPRLARVEREELWITQRWYQSADDPLKLKEQFQLLINSFLVKMYPEFKEDYSNMHHQDAITVYKPGDYTQIHRDGQNEGRVCVVLMYLTPESMYNNGGGELTVLGDDQSDSTNPELLTPVRGNVAILDFNNHNPHHGVNPVLNDFNRYCYLSFVWNTDKMPENIRPKGYQ